MSMFERLACPKCKAITTWTRMRKVSQVMASECPVSDGIHQLVVDLVDPMKSRTTTGWLRGELRARTQGRPVLGKVSVIVVAISAAIGFSVWMVDDLTRVRLPTVWLHSHSTPALLWQPSFGHARL